MRIDADMVRRMTAPQSFQRGCDYARSGSGGRIRPLADGVRATVFGSDRYTVELQSGSEAELDCRCTCSVGASGAFCKHCVALAVVASESEHSQAPDPHAYLEGLGREELIEMILDAADRDEVLHTKVAVASAATDSAHDLLVRQTIGEVPASVRLLLDLLADGVKLTPGGRLPRAVVRQVQEQRPHWYPLGRPASVEEVRGRASTR